jgi:ABC-2 type transport system permease protein
MLLRPIAYLDAKIIETIAQGLVNLLFIGATCLLWCTWWTGHFPFSIGQVFAILILGLGGLILCSLMGILVGLFSFWFNEIYSLFFFWQQILFICGGLIVPVSTFPKLLYIVSFLVPSPFILGLRSEFIFSPRFLNFLFIFSGEILWFFLLVKILRALFRKGMKTFNTCGG